MQKSTETRWILNANEFDIVLTWYRTHQLYFKEPDIYPRQDYYLLLPDTKNLGIKIREPKPTGSGSLKSKLEIKILTADDGVQHFNLNNAGVVTHWSKFSFETIENEAETMGVVNLFSKSEMPGTWIKIEKDRLLLKFDTQTKAIVSGDQIIPEGSGLEITRFKINLMVYYSFGIEAFSSSDTESGNFSATMDFLFNEIPIQHLKPDRSLSYPEILSRHFTGK